MPRKDRPKQPDKMVQWRREDAGTITTRYPNIAAITFEFIWTNPPVAKTFTETRERKPEDSALFVFKCRYEDCVGGGHDLDKEIDGKIAQHAGEFGGKSTCQGWQSPERVGKHQCLGDLAYVVRVDYSD